ncbi:glycosyltransferase family 4 protein [Phaeobacter porticola]|uniref:Glycosyltransferase n=1 Tax=Phaeobacter porticola TaxID=1844006 RepID=A0A1L3I850_9RHOB|nr:glycosyltransferase family 4 protein [Phaeobacter porticola]APG48293.1 Glycosyltransferase [Phaeobacter porticola]
MKPGHGHHIAFYAPMKSPQHPVPSGDREMARNLMGLLSKTGAEVTLITELRIYDKLGDPKRQKVMRTKAALEVDRLCAELAALPETERPVLWLTYHNYYKAPDLIGPEVADRLGIPYVQIESTRAKKRLIGPWADFAKAAHDAADAAAVIFYLTSQDHETLLRDRCAEQQLIHLSPFLPGGTLPTASALSGPMLSVGMMRTGDKLASYRILAAALAEIPATWQLEIAGDGPARAEVEALMAPFGNQVRFLGQLQADALTAAYQRASFFVWPGVNEAFGMVYLEAQSHGLPVLAQDRPGLRDVVAPWEDADLSPTPEVGPTGFAAAMSRLLTDADLLRRQACRVRTHITDRHLAPAAAKTLWSALTPLLEITP